MIMPVNNALAVAKMLGDRTYLNKKPCVCGCTERYTVNSSCVDCAKAAAAASRKKIERARKRADAKARTG